MTDILHTSSSLFYKLLVVPRFRIVRHILFILVLGVISFSQAAFLFRIDFTLLETNLYPLAFILFCVYLLVGYFHLYVLVPRLLLKKQYITYLLCSSLSVLLLMFTRLAEEYWINTLAGITYSGNWLTLLRVTDTLSDFMLNMLCMSGISVAGLLTYWMAEKEKEIELEQKQIQTEIEEFHEQVNPTILFNTLNQASALVKKDAGKTSDMLYRLSELLRYQLYDCNREKVLLTSEISFLKNYFSLRKLSTTQENLYELNIQGNSGSIFVPPLLFLSIVQSIVEQQDTEEIHLYVSFEITGEQLLFRMKSNLPIHFSEENEMKFKQKLNAFYPDRYNINQKPTNKEWELILQ